MATNSSILSWRIRKDREAWRLQSMVSQRIRHDWVTKHNIVGLKCFRCIAKWFSYIYVCLSRFVFFFNRILQEIEYKSLYFLIYSYCYSVPNLCLTLCNHMDGSMPGFPGLQHLLKFVQLMSIKPVIPSNHLSICLPLLLWPSIFASIWGFSNELGLVLGDQKNWSFNFSLNPSNEHSW